MTAHTAITMTPDKLEMKASIAMEPQKRCGPAPPSMWSNVAVGSRACFVALEYHVYAA